MRGGFGRVIRDSECGSYMCYCNKYIHLHLSWFFSSKSGKASHGSLPVSERES